MNYGNAAESVAQWEMDKHMAIELYPMNLEKQKEYMKRRKKVK